MSTSPASDLRYVGDGRFLPGIPADDLDAGQLAAIARKRGLSPSVLRARLIASGLYAPARKGKQT